MCFTGEHTERLENVLVNKHENTHASSEMTNGKSSESVQLAMLKACDACADIGQ